MDAPPPPPQQRRLLAVSPAAKLLAADILSLTFRPPSIFLDPLTSLHVSRVEALGVVVSRDQREKYLRFVLDDGTGCTPCILWLNQLTQPWMAERFGVAGAEAAAEAAEGAAEAVALGKVVGVRGRVTAYRGEVQVTVAEAWEEGDPNAEVLHWLDCVKLARWRKGGCSTTTTTTAAAATTCDGRKRRKTSPLL